MGTQQMSFHLRMTVGANVCNGLKEALVNLLGGLPGIS
jgi:hypothetical protein